MRFGLICGLLVFSLQTFAQQVDTLIVNGQLYDGSGSAPRQLDIAIQGNVILDIGENLSKRYTAYYKVDAKGLVVAPGFIDPHTHSLMDLLSKPKAANINYLTQGVTTVFNGNDGGGSAKIAALAKKLQAQGIGTNTAFLAGHGYIRKQVMGLTNQHASVEQIAKMQSLLVSAMEQGAYGFSSGLYYVPGTYSTTAEVVELARVVKPFGGFYETHIRNESELGAFIEAIDIGRQAKIPVHLAHIKALGKDAWGLSSQIISLVEQANKEGVKVTADQYPWKASGTRLSNAVFPKWIMADSREAFVERLNDPQLVKKLMPELIEKIRWRGGPDSLLLVANNNPDWSGKTLGQIAKEQQKLPHEMAIEIVKLGDSRVASFNMSEGDIANFMTQPWVMTSSDGTQGHPRKFASFPKKYHEFVKQKKLLTLGEFIHRSSGLTAKAFGIENRGFIKPGMFADIQVIDLDNYRPNAGFTSPEKLSTGVRYLWVNGELTLKDGVYTGKLAGVVLRKGH